MVARADRFDEELLRTTVDVARIGICFIDPDGNFVYVNPAQGRDPVRRAGELEGARRPLDENLLRHALGNLLSNALKFSRGGKVTLELEANGAGLQFRVSDQGIGIPEGNRARLFATFHRGANFTVSIPAAQAA